MEPYIRMNYYMNRFQAYDNVLFVYVDDASKDTTFQTLTELTKDDPKFLVIRNDDNGSQGKAYMYAINYLEQHELIHDEDIIVEVDGDDWLSGNFVLPYVNQIYQDENIWMTYGHYQVYPDGVTGGHYHMDIYDQVDSQNSHRYHAFPYSHLKTYKYWLFNKIDRRHLIDPSSGQIFSSAWDHALCISMVEMAGKKHIHRCDDILYIYNCHPDLQAESKTRLNEQKQTEMRIRQQPSYSKL